MATIAPHRNGARPQLASRPPVLDRTAFTELLVKERKRSERSNRPLILLTIRSEAGLEPAVLDVLTSAIRATDILGWLDSPEALGLILVEIGDAEPAHAIATVRARLFHALGQGMSHAALAAVTIESRIYPESSDDDTSSGPGAIDPMFHADLSNDERKRRPSDLAKRALDLLISGTVLLCVAPLLLLIALAVKLTSPGPVLFRQVRIGKMGKPFEMLKFRSMYVGCAQTAHQDFVTRFIKESRLTNPDGENRIFKLTNDSRITPVGRILRKTSLDELPQVWNVLVGQMSLVGPRPPLPYEVAEYAPWHRRRILEAKPGITGLWQVSGRSRTTFDEMVRLDLRYARTRSLWTDLVILLRTPAAVVGGKGAC
jgi:lipopolysaccharide/colanic/teichoic acid biosynthesis glycosyltransferase